MIRGGKLECSQKPYCNYFNFIISGKCIKMRKEPISDNYGIFVAKASLKTGTVSFDNVSDYPSYIEYGILVEKNL